MSGDSRSPAEYWDARARQYGYDLKTLAYGSPRTQQRKFDVLISAIRARRLKLLDVGCGFGDLCFHLRERGFDVDYCGIDLSERIVDLAKAARPELRIVHGDLLDERTLAGEQFDHVVSTGINCAEHGRNAEVERQVLRRMFELCTVGAAMGLQSRAFVERNPDAAREQGSWFSDPTALCAYALHEITPWVTLRHDYMPHDFTLFLFREPCEL